MEALNLVANEYELRVEHDGAISCHWTPDVTDCRGLLAATIDSDGTLRRITWSGVQPGPIRLVVIADGVLLVERDYRYVGRATTDDSVCDASCGKTTIEVQ